MVRNMVASVLLATVAAAYYMAADDLTISPLDVAAATTDQFPKRIAAAVIVLSLVMMAQALLARRRAPAADGASPEADGGEAEPGHRSAFVMLAIGIAYVTLLNVIGYAAATALLVAIGAVFLGRRMSVEVVLVAVGTALVSWLLFGVLLGIQMPRGRWAELLPGTWL